LLIIGIVCLALAIALAGFLLYRSLSAQAGYQHASAAAGLELEAGEQVPADADAEYLADINWDALQQINPEIVAWILVPDTRINYPVVQAGDNDYYLTHLFDRTDSSVGAIFLDCDNAPTLGDRNNMIYGHNMMDGSMFASLQSFREQAFFDENRTVYIATPEHVLTLQTVAVVVCEGDDELRQLGFADDVGFRAYLNELLNYAVIADADATAQVSQLFMLATCTDLNNSKRTILLLAPIDQEGVADAV
jgi:sortase B